MIFRGLLFFSLLFLLGCERSALMLHQQKVSANYLASTNVGSPDPRTPPNGQMIVAEWIVPSSLLKKDPLLRIEVLYKDFTESCMEYPIKQRFGYETFCVLNKEFKSTGGFLAYHAEIVTDDGCVYADWSHQLWVKLINIEDEETDLMSSAVAGKSIQPSVTEIPR